MNAFSAVRWSRASRFASRCLALVLVGLLLVRSSVAADPPPPPPKLVILLPPSAKAWIPLLEESAKLSLAGGWPVIAHNPEPETKRRPEHTITHQVGKSVGEVKDASMVIQFGAPKPFVRGTFFMLDVPFTIYDVPKAGGKPVEVAKGNVSRGGNSYDHAAEILARGGLRTISDSLRTDSAHRIFADKPKLATDQGGVMYAYAPVTVDKTTNPPTALVKFKNQFPVPVMLGLAVQSKTSLVPNDQYFSFGGFIVAAGEARTIAVSLKDLKPGQEPKVAQLGSVLFVDPPTEK